MDQPLVAVTADVRSFDGYVWHATPEQYLRAAIDSAGVLPLLLPAFGPKIDLDGLLERVDGVIVTGSRTNVHPDLYGGEASERNGPYDPARDATSLPLIRKALDAGVPLLAICRGIQELNVALGGTLATEVHQRPGNFDHRGPEDDDHDALFAVRQTVTVRPGSCMADLVGAGTLRVNSVHRQAVGTLAQRLVVEAVADDGTIEAVGVRDARAFAVGVQWHPEYWSRDDTASARIFEAFGDAARRRAGSRATV